MPLEAAVARQCHNNKIEIPTFSQVGADHRDNNSLYCIFDVNSRYIHTKYSSSVYLFLVGEY
jgi:hypothetical protein